MEIISRLTDRRQAVDAKMAGFGDGEDDDDEAPGPTDRARSDAWVKPAIRLSRWFFRSPPESPSHPPTSGTNGLAVLPLSSGLIRVLSSALDRRVDDSGKR
jgi:hypothetical protein